MKNKTKWVSVVILIVFVVIGLISLYLYYSGIKEKKEEQIHLQRLYEHQNSMFAIGEDVNEYRAYSSVNERNLQLRLLYYNIDEGITITLEDVEAFLKNEYKENGVAKTYKDDRRMNALVTWWYSYEYENIVSDYTNSINWVLGDYGRGIKLDEYSNREEEEKVDDVPLSMIRKLQDSYQKENIERKDIIAHKVSPETIVIANEIYLYLISEGKWKYEVY